MSDKNVYVLLTDTGTLFTKTIKLYTRKPYNHASIAFDEDLTKVYSFGRKKPRNPFIGGFVHEDIRTGLFKHATCAVYRLTIKEKEFYKMQNYIEQMNARKECYRYNLLGLLAVILNKQLQRDHAFFCSEFVASVLMHSEEVHFDIPLSLITPHDIQQLEKLKLVYQGPMMFYKSDKNNMHPLEFQNAVITA